MATMLLKKNNTPISFEKFIENLSKLKFNKEPHTFGIEDDNILNDFANYLITYLFIIIAIINDDNNLLIAACLITPFPNDLKTAFYNNSSNLWYIWYIFCIIVLYFFISMIIGYLNGHIYRENRYKNNNIEKFYQSNIIFNTDNHRIIYTILISVLISFSVCFYSANFSNNSGNNIGMGIALTLLPSLVISGYNYGKLIHSKQTSHLNSNKEITKNIAEGSGLFFLLNFLLYLLCLLLFYLFFNKNENDNDNKQIENLFYFEKSLEEIFDELKENSTAINDMGIKKKSNTIVNV